MLNQKKYVSLTRFIGLSLVFFGINNGVRKTRNNKSKYSDAQKFPAFLPIIRIKY